MSEIQTIIGSDLLKAAELTSIKAKGALRPVLTLENFGGRKIEVPDDAVWEPCGGLWVDAHKTTFEKGDLQWQALNDPEGCFVQPERATKHHEFWIETPEFIVDREVCE